jgi:signal peptidase I
MLHQRIARFPAFDILVFMDHKTPESSDAASEKPSSPGLEHISTDSRLGKGFLAVCGSFLFPGFGHLIVGSWRAGLAWAAVSLCLNVLAFVALASVKCLFVEGWILIAGTILTVVFLIHAFRTGRRSPFRLGPVWFRYVAGLGLLVFAAKSNLNLFIAHYFRNHWVDSFSVASRAMSPTLEPGDRFLLNKTLSAQRWSLVVVQYPGEEGIPIITRLAGLPGERIEIINGELTVNGAVKTRPAGAGPYSDMPYVGYENAALRGHACAACSGNPLTLGPEEYFVLGDNSSRAKDSRLLETSVSGHPLGALPRSYLQPGRVTAIYWPPSRWRIFDR